MIKVIIKFSSLRNGLITIMIVPVSKVAKFNLKLKLTKKHLATNTLLFNNRKKLALDSCRMSK